MDLICNSHQNYNSSDVDGCFLSGPNTLWPVDQATIAGKGNLVDNV